MPYPHAFSPADRTDRRSINARCYVLKLIFQPGAELIKQGNLSEVPDKVSRSGLLPSSGMLWFFCDAENLSFGGPDDYNGFGVLYSDVPTRYLHVAEVPEGLADYCIFAPRPLYRSFLFRPGDPTSSTPCSPRLTRRMRTKSS